MASVRPVVVAVISAVVYAAMWVGHRQGWGWLSVVDSSSLQVLHVVGVEHPLWVQTWDVVCAVFSPFTFRLLGAVAAVIVLSKRRVRAAVFLIVSVEFSELITWAAKGLAGRPRPTTALVAASASSFPSGHALAATVGVLALGAVLLPVTSRSVRVVAAMVGALIVLAVGFGRVALNVHYPSDVVAGWALGYLYFALCAGVCGLSGSSRRGLVRPRACGRGQGCAESPPVCPRHA